MVEEGNLGSVGAKVGTVGKIVLEGLYLKGSDLWLEVIGIVRYYFLWRGCVEYNGWILIILLSTPFVFLALRPAKKDNFTAMSNFISNFNIIIFFLFRLLASERTIKYF